MIRLVITYIACLSVFSACKKSSSTNELASLVGSWELRHRSGGWAGDSSYKTGNGNIYKFTATNYEHYIKHQLVESGVYRLEVDSVQIGNILVAPAYERIHRIIINNDATTAIPIKIQSDFFIHGYFQAPVDGVERKYVRVGSQ
jgi:hypothetical protein